MNKNWLKINNSIKFKKLTEIHLVLVMHDICIMSYKFLIKQTYIFLNKLKTRREKRRLINFD